MSLSDSGETFRSVESHVFIDVFIVRDTLLSLVLVSHEVLFTFWFLILILMVKKVKTHNW